MDISIPPGLLLALLTVLVISGASTLVLFIKRKGLPPETSFSTEDRVLWALGAPLLIAIAAGGFIWMALRRNRTEIPRSEAVLQSPIPSVGETRGEQVVRIITEQGDAVEKHLLHEATDDEVAARGASLFSLPPREGGEGPTDPDEDDKVV